MRSIFLATLTKFLHVRYIRTSVKSKEEGQGYARRLSNVENFYIET